MPHLSPNTSSSLGIIDCAEKIESLLQLTPREIAFFNSVMQQQGMSLKKSTDETSVSHCAYDIVTQVQAQNPTSAYIIQGRFMPGTVFDRGSYWFSVSKVVAQIRAKESAIHNDYLALQRQGKLGEWQRRRQYVNSIQSLAIIRKVIECRLYLYNCLIKGEQSLAVQFDKTLKTSLLDDKFVKQTLSYLNYLGGQGIAHAFSSRCRNIAALCRSLHSSLVEVDAEIFKLRTLQCGSELSISHHDHINTVIAEHVSSVVSCDYRVKEIFKELANNMTLVINRELNEQWLQPEEPGIQSNGDLIQKFKSVLCSALALDESDLRQMLSNSHILLLQLRREIKNIKAFSAADEENLKALHELLLTTMAEFQQKQQQCFNKLLGQKQILNVQIMKLFAEYQLLYLKMVYDLVAELYNVETQSIQSQDQTYALSLRSILFEVSQKIKATSLFMQSGNMAQVVAAELQQSIKPMEPEEEAELTEEDIQALRSQQLDNIRVKYFMSDLHITMSNALSSGQG